MTDLDPTQIAAIAQLLARLARLKAWFKEFGDPRELRDPNLVELRESLRKLALEEGLAKKKRLYLEEVQQQLVARGLLIKVETFHDVSYEETPEYERYKKILESKE